MRPGTLSRPASALVAVALWAAALLCWSYIARDLAPLEPRAGWPPEIARRAPPLARYDSGWYRKIAEEGYGRSGPPSGQMSEHAFFPLYPALVGAIARALSVDPFPVGIAVSLACLAAAAILFLAEARRRAGDLAAFHALLFFLLFPTAFFLASMYAESLFLLLALLAFTSLARERYAVAALFGLLAGLTRLPALALVLPLGLTAAGYAVPAETPLGRSRARPSVRVLRGVLVGLAPAAGVFFWIWAVGHLTGEPGLYFRLQESWDRATSPIAGIVRWASALPLRIARGDARAHPSFLIDYADAILFLALAVVAARRRRWSDASWMAGALFLPAATGISASLPRYLVVVYPAFYTLEELLRPHPILRRFWWLASAALLLAGTAAFVNWRWVA